MAPMRTVTPCTMNQYDVRFECHTSLPCRPLFEPSPVGLIYMQPSQLSRSPRPLPGTRSNRVRHPFDVDAGGVEEAPVTRWPWHLTIGGYDCVQKHHVRQQRLGPRLSKRPRPRMHTYLSRAS